MKPAAKPRREKSIDDRALEAKSRIATHLEAVAALMDEVAKDNIEVSFSVARNEHGAFSVQGLSLLRRY